MIVDANILLYAYNADDPRHESAKRWLEDALNGETLVGLPWQTLSAFLLISTNPRVFTDPIDPGAAFDQVEDWLAAPRSWIPKPTDRYPSILGRLVREHSVAGPLVTDASLAALAIDHGVAVASTDGDFARFDVEWINPIT